MHIYRKVLLVVVTLSLLILAGAQSAMAASGPSATRQLAAVQVKVQHLRKQAHRHQTAVNFWHHRGKWILQTRQKQCTEMFGERGQRICHIGRRDLAVHARQLMSVQRKLAALMSADGVLGYRHFDNCLDAVGYLFQGRWDLERALRVVDRESKGDPNATNGNYWGCGQMSPTLRRGFLSGSWNDPYYNVLAMRRAIDDPNWGWCNWDIVNYCAPGGDW